MKSIAEFLENKGTGIWIKKDDSSREILKSILDNSEKLNTMKKNTKLLAKKHSTENMCNVLLGTQLVETS